MVLNPHRAKQKVALWFASVVKTMQENNTPVNMRDILRHVRLNHPVSLKAFKEDINELYVEAGILKYDVATGDLVATQTTRNDTTFPKIDAVYATAEKEADDMIKRMLP